MLNLQCLQEHHERSENKDKHIATNTTESRAAATGGRMADPRPRVCAAGHGYLRKALSAAWAGLGSGRNARHLPCSWLASTAPSLGRGGRCMCESERVGQRGQGLCREEEVDSDGCQERQYRPRAPAAPAAAKPATAAASGRQWLQHTHLLLTTA